jgi:hypothetical protein
MIILRSTNSLQQFAVHMIALKKHYVTRLRTSDEFLNRNAIQLPEVNGSCVEARTLIRIPAHVNIYHIRPGMKMVLACCPKLK